MFLAKMQFSSAAVFFNTLEAGFDLGLVFFKDE